MQIAPFEPRDLGPFTLDRLAGRGATARVFHGRHRATDTPVAVKILTGVGPDETFGRVGFAREVRAVARLDHPAIIRLHDYGALPAALAGALGEAIAPDAPYLVMDWHAGGTLAARQGRVGFAEARALLLTVLDALAHAHARGVVHRDLKPANVLLGAEGAVLSDFGLVLDADVRDPGEGQPAGTPNYMAPEQVRHDWRAFGPWTDLYAVGCLAWALVCGAAPFAGRGVQRIMIDHVASAPPPFAPRCPVPEGFEPWLRRLLRKDPGERYAFAADAAVALMALPDPGPAETAGDGPIADDGPTLRAPPVFVALDEHAWGAGPAPDDRAPRPTDWRRPHAPWAPHFAGCGRALAELREMRLRGRLAERDRLWALLGEVVDGRGARAALIEGGPGIGKSRLMRWLARRAHELGQAEAVYVSHAPAPGPGHGLRPALARALRLDGLRPDEAGPRIRRRLGVDAPLAAALAALGDADLTAEVDGFRITLAAREVEPTVLDGLAALAARRPLVVQIDDAQWGEPALRLVLRALEHRADLPILFALTVRTDAVDPRVARTLSTLGRKALRLPLGPLDAAAQGRSAADRLPLAPTTAARLAGITAGNPLFAGELLRHWLHTEALAETADGFRLRPDHPAPPSLGALLRARLDSLLGDLRPDAMPALELAATLGAVVDEVEWRAVLEQAERPHPAAAVARLLDAGLAESSGGRLVFGHTLVREALLDRARGAGRLARWHTACAAGLLVAGERTGRPPDPVRRALHLDAAGHPGAAFRCWRAAIEAAEDAWGAVVEADVHLLLGAARAGRRAGLRRDEPAWIALKLSWSAHQNTRRRGLGLRHARQAHARAGSAGDRPLLSRALRQLARCLRDRGDLAGADARLAESEAICLAIGDGPMEAATRRERATVALVRGDLDAAEALLIAALRRLAARDVPRNANRRYQLMEAHNQLGEIARRRGDLDAAGRAYGRALRILGPDDDTVLPSLLALNLALIDLERDATARAEARAAKARERLIRAGIPRYRIYAESVLLACAADRGDPAAWDRAWSGLGPVRSLDFVYLDVARLLDRAGRRAARSLPGRAASARAIAIRQYQALGRPDDADDLAGFAG